MIKCKWHCLKFLFLIIPVLYGCSSTHISTLPPVYKPEKPKTEIVIPDSIMSELNKFKIRPWKYIVIHHSASDSGNAASIGKYHKNERGILSYITALLIQAMPPQLANITKMRGDG